MNIKYIIILASIAFGINNQTVTGCKVECCRQVNSAQEPCDFTLTGVYTFVDVRMTPKEASENCTERGMVLNFQKEENQNHSREKLSEACPQVDLAGVFFLDSNGQCHLMLNGSRINCCESCKYSFFCVQNSTLNDTEMVCGGARGFTITSALVMALLFLLVNKM